jgi:hypothetical protein
MKTSATAKKPDDSVAARWFPEDGDAGMLEF